MNQMLKMNNTVLPLYIGSDVANELARNEKRTLVTKNIALALFTKISGFIGKGQWRIGTINEQRLNNRDPWLEVYRQGKEF